MMRTLVMPSIPIYVQSIHNRWIPRTTASTQSEDDYTKFRPPNSLLLVMIIYGDFHLRFNNGSLPTQTTTQVHPQMPSRLRLIVLLGQEPVQRHILAMHPIPRRQVPEAVTVQETKPVSGLLVRLTVWINRGPCCHCLCLYPTCLPPMDQRNWMYVHSPGPE